MDLNMYTKMIDLLNSNDYIKIQHDIKNIIHSEPSSRMILSWNPILCLRSPALSEAKSLKKAPEGLGKNLVALPDPKPAPEVVGSQVGHHCSFM